MPNAQLTNPWRVQSGLSDLQNIAESQTVRLPNGENYNLTTQTTQREMFLAQSRCIGTAIYMMK